VHEQGGDAAEFDDNGLGQQHQAGRAGKGLPGEEVAIAGHEENRDAGIGQAVQACADAGIEGVVEIVVPCPVLE